MPRHNDHYSPEPEPELEAGGGFSPGGTGVQAGGSRQTARQELAAQLLQEPTSGSTVDAEVTIHRKAHETVVAKKVASVRWLSWQLGAYGFARWMKAHAFLRMNASCDLPKSPCSGEDWGPGRLLRWILGLHPWSLFLLVVAVAVFILDPSGFMEAVDDARALENTDTMCLLNFTQVEVPTAANCCPYSADELVGNDCLLKHCVEYFYKHPIEDKLKNLQTWKHWAEEDRDQFSIQSVDSCTRTNIWEAPHYRALETCTVTVTNSSSGQPIQTQRGLESSAQVKIPEVCLPSLWCNCAKRAANQRNFDMLYSAATLPLMCLFLLARLLVIKIATPGGSGKRQGPLSDAICPMALAQFFADEIQDPAVDGPAPLKVAPADRWAEHQHLKQSKQTFQIGNIVWESDGQKMDGVEDVFRVYRRSEDPHARSRSSTSNGGSSRNSIPTDSYARWPSTPRGGSSRNSVQTARSGQESQSSGDIRGDHSLEAHCCKRTFAFLRRTSTDVQQRLTRTLSSEQTDAQRIRAQTAHDVLSDACRSVFVQGWVPVLAVMLWWFIVPLDYLDLPGKPDTPQTNWKYFRHHINENLGKLLTWENGLSFTPNNLENGESHRFLSVLRVPLFILVDYPSHLAGALLLRAVCTIHQQHAFTILDSIRKSDGQSLRSVADILQEFVELKEGMRATSNRWQWLLCAQLAIFSVLVLATVCQMLISQGHDGHYNWSDFSLTFLQLLPLLLCIKAVTHSNGVIDEVPKLLTSMCVSRDPEDRAKVWVADECSTFQRDRTFGDLYAEISSKLFRLVFENTSE